MPKPFARWRRRRQEDSDQSSPPRVSSDKKRNGWENDADVSPKLISLIPPPVSSGPTAAQRLSSGPSLVELPVELLLKIFLTLDVVEILALSQVCRALHDLASSRTIWNEYACDLLRRGRRIALHGRLSLIDLSLSELRRSVVSRATAERAWLRDGCTHKSSKAYQIGFWRLDNEASILQGINPRYLLCPIGDEALLGWDMRKDVQAGLYYFTTFGSLAASMADPATNSMYCLKVRAADDTDDELVTSEIAVLRVDFPAADVEESQPLVFTEVHLLALTMTFVSKDCQILSVPDRMFCVAFARIETWSTILQIVLDWSTGLSTYIDMGTAYVFGRSVISAHLSVDDQHLVVHSGDDAGSQWARWYSMAEIRASASLQATGAAWEPVFVTPTPERMYRLADNGCTPCLASIAEVKTVYVAGTRWPSMDDVPPIMSTTILYDSLSGPIGGPEGLWGIAQYYDRTDAPPARAPDAGAAEDGCWCSCARNTIFLHDVAVSSDATRPGGAGAGVASAFPMASVTFSHIAWIAMEEAGWALPRVDVRLRTLGFVRFRRRYRRSLKIVTLPDPCAALQDPSGRTPCERRMWPACVIKAIEGIPKEVLDKANRIELDAVNGTITLGTRVKRKKIWTTVLHVFRYA